MTRSEAIEVGSTTYFTGQPCPRGHIDVRFVASYGCRECLRLRSKAAYDADPESGSKRNRAYRKSHPEKAADLSRAWAQKNPLKHQVVQINADAKRRGAPGRMSEKEWAELLDQCGHRCPACGREDVRLTADHIIPIVHGGPHTIENIQPLCLKCNQRKQLDHTDYRPPVGEVA